jgi:hypothetical protein
MRRPKPSILVLVTVAFVAALLGFSLSARASAGGPGFGYGPGMMGAGYGPSGGGGYGPGMMGGYYGSTQTATPTGSPTLLIRHQYAHCHTWSLNGGPFTAKQTVTLKRGATLTVIDDDVMPHQLVKLAGGSVTMRNGTTMPMMGRYLSSTPGLMNHMGASTAATFSTGGVYRFRTRAGDDYMPGIQTSGADNVLTLTVTVH